MLVSLQIFPSLMKAGDPNESPGFLLYIIILTPADYNNDFVWPTLATSRNLIWLMKSPCVHSLQIKESYRRPHRRICSHSK
ncbi:hypothetical protein HHI36_014776 [Cryptolaemus montrouzieri]|uniref:Uncharacterized protein n=1 Tax=Cryptolaemus montrouzieri TaxID=559131 RepID=A0ABD2N4G7_9CUCU